MKKPKKRRKLIKKCRGWKKYENKESGKQLTELEKKFYATNKMSEIPLEKSIHTYTCLN